MSHLWMPSRVQAIADLLIELFESGQDDPQIARALQSIDALAALGHVVTVSDAIGIYRIIATMCGPLGELDGRIDHVCERFADDDTAAKVLGLRLIDLVGCLRPVLGAQGCGRKRFFPLAVNPDPA